MEITKKSSLVYNGVIFKVYSDDVIVKNNIEAKRDVVKNNGGVAVLAIINNRILLVRQYRYAVQNYTYEIPAGKLEDGECPFDSALRELEEETGFTTQNLKPLCKLYSTPGFCAEQLHLFYTNELIKMANPRAMDEDEDIELILMDIDEALNLVYNGKILDSKTVVAIQYAKLNLQK